MQAPECRSLRDMAPGASFERSDFRQVRECVAEWLAADLPPDDPDRRLMLSALALEFADADAARAIAAVCWLQSPDSAVSWLSYGAGLGDAACMALLGLWEIEAASCRDDRLSGLARWLAGVIADPAAADVAPLPENDFTATEIANAVGRASRFGCAVH